MQTVEEVIPIGAAYFSARPKINDNPGEIVYGYYVFSRGRHYILQDYGGDGYDERWETADWVEILPSSLNQIK